MPPRHSTLRLTFSPQLPDGGLMSALPADDDEDRDENANGEPSGEADEATGGQSEDAEREEVRHLPEGLWQRLRSAPILAPQYLALAAVNRWGEQARQYAAQVQREHPDAPSRELAQMVKSRHALLARMEGAAAG